MAFVSFFAASTGIDSRSSSVFTGESRRPNIILITLESTRADHLPCYDYHRNTTPNICKLAEDGVLFEQAYSAGTSTHMSMPSLLTSLPPNSVGMSDWSVEFPHEARTFIEVLKGRGFRIVGNPIHESDITKNFDKIYDIQDGPDVVRKIKGEVSDKQTPTLAFIFFNNLAHPPFFPNEDYRVWESLPLDFSMMERHWGENNTYKIKSFIQVTNTTIQEVKTLYDEEVLMADSAVGELLDRLKERGTYRDSLIIVTSDHGMAFGEHGHLGNGGPPYEEVSHIPLIIKFPKNRFSGEKVNQPVSHIDIEPTIYDYLSLKVDKRTFGASLVPIIKGNNVEDNKVFSATNPRKKWMVRKGDYKYFLENPEEVCKHGKRPVVEKLYNLERDPKEEKNLVNRKVKMADELQEELCQIYLQGSEIRYPRGEADLTEKQKEKLRRLGYLDQN